MKPDLTGRDPAYVAAIEALRERMSDEEIVDVLERYVHGGYDRDDAMEKLDIDYLGTLYELDFVYGIERPAPDPEEQARGEMVMRMLLDGETVPVELRQPAAWRKH